MLRLRAYALATAAVLALAAPSARAASFLQAGPNALCGAGGCFAVGNSFRQTWSAADRSGQLSIGSLMLDRGIIGTNQDMLFKVSFRLADGTKVGDWGSFMIAGLSGEVVRLGGQAFNWDTSQGDLILQLDLVVPDKGGGGGFFAGGGGGGGGGGSLASVGGGFGSSMTVAAETPAFSASEIMPMNDVLMGAPHGGRGGIGFDPAVSAPEPSSWALMLLGFGAAGAMLRTRRRTLRYG
jgi:hypothetical protein